MSVGCGLQRRSLYRSRVVGLSLSAASLGAGAIHAAVVPEHLEETWLFGTFFIMCAVFQIGWAIAVVVSPSPGVYLAGILANGAMMAVWAVSRTTGLPIGPEPWTPEAVGALDLIATGLELLIVAGAARVLSANEIDRRSDG